MSCTNPFEGYISLDLDENGKHTVLFTNKGLTKITKGETEEQQESLWTNGTAVFKKQMIPCGKCIGCRMDYAKEKAKRVELESKYTIGNWFLTITYDNENLPMNGKYPTLRRQDMKRFIDRLRRNNAYNYGINIKYLAAGEYGENTHRPHYHAIILNLQIPDLQPIMIKNDIPYYTSKEITRCWGKGQILIARSNTATTTYVAGYCEKKALSEHEFDYKENEFISQSKNLGKQYYEDHKNELFSDVKMTFSGHAMNQPKYFTKLAKQEEFALNLIENETRRQKTVARHQTEYYQRTYKLKTQQDVRARQELELKGSYKNRTL